MKDLSSLIKETENDADLEGIDDGIEIDEVEEVEESQEEETELVATIIPTDTAATTKGKTFSTSNKFIPQKIKIGGPELIVNGKMHLASFEAVVTVPKIDEIPSLDGIHFISFYMVKPASRSIKEDEIIRSERFDTCADAVGRIMSMRQFVDNTNPDIVDIYEEYADETPTKENTSTDIRNKYQAKLEKLLIKKVDDIFGSVLID